MSIINLEIYDLPTQPFMVSKMQAIYENCLSWQYMKLNEKTNDYKKDIEKQADEKEACLRQSGISEKDIKNLIQAFKEENNKILKSKSKQDLISLDKAEILESYIPLTNYIYSFYYEISKGNYYKYDVEKDIFEIVEKKDFMNEVILKLDKSLLALLFEKNYKIYSIVSKLDKPRVYSINGSYYINECKGFLHKNPKPFNTFSEEIKIKFQVMMDYIKEITCNNDEEFYQAYIKYLSQLCKGQKTQVIIYKKSEQGTGKSTESDFIIKYVLGQGICLVSGTEPLTSNFNKIFMGKLFILFEELPTFSTAAWSGVSSKLKTLATDPLTVYRDLFEKAIQAENISNFVINTNVEAIKDSDGRRIVIAPINNSRIGDYDFFDNVRKNCFNLDVGECFFSYMLEVDTTNFIAQCPKRGFPETDVKRIAHVELLQSHEKFLKTNFLLKNIGIDKIKPLDLHNMYKSYCIEINKKPLTKNDFLKKLEQLNIKYTKVGTNFYKISYDALKEIAEKRKWLCQYDVDLADDEEDEEEEEFINDPLDGKEPNKAYYEKQIKQKDRENMELKALIQQLQNKLIEN
jgi:hypothetical protein